MASAKNYGLLPPNGATPLTPEEAKAAYAAKVAENKEKAAKKNAERRQRAKEEYVAKNASAVASTKPQSATEKVSGVKLSNKRPLLGGTSKVEDAEVLFAEAEPELEEGVEYEATVKSSGVNETKDRHKLTLKLENGELKKFSEPFPFHPEYSAMGRLYRDNGLIRLADLEGLEVVFIVSYNVSKSNGRRYPNIRDIGLITYDESEDYDISEEDEAEEIDAVEDVEEPEEDESDDEHEEKEAQSLSSFFDEDEEDEEEW